MGTISLRFFIENLKKAEPRIKTVEEAVRFFHILVEGTGDGKRGGVGRLFKILAQRFQPIFVS